MKQRSPLQGEAARSAQHFNLHEDIAALLPLAWNNHESNNAVSHFFFFSWGILNLRRLRIFVGTLSTSQCLRLRMKTIWYEVCCCLTLTSKGDRNILLSSKRWILNKQHFGCIGAIWWIARGYAAHHVWLVPVTRTTIPLLHDAIFSDIHLGQVGCWVFDLCNDNFSVVLGIFFLWES